MADLFGAAASVGQIASNFFNIQKTWSLKMEDRPGTEYVGQFVAENAVESINTQIPTIDSVGGSQASPQFSSGGEETFTFTARIYAEHSFQNVQRKILELKSFSKKRFELKRTPIFTFTYGSELAFKCFVRSPGGIRYDEPRLNGSLRGATFSMTLVKISDEALPPVGQTLSARIKEIVGVVASAAGLASRLSTIDVPGGSLKRTGRVHVFTDGEKFEDIAAEEYGSPIHGDILRRAHPQSRLAQPGDKIQLLVEEDVLDTKVTPQSIMLKDERITIALKNEFLLKRSKNKTIFI